MPIPSMLITCRLCGAQPNQGCFDPETWVLHPDTPDYLHYIHAERVADAAFVAAMSAPATDRAMLTDAEILATDEV